MAIANVDTTAGAPPVGDDEVTADLVHLERVMAQGLQGFLQVGEALVRIRDAGLDRVNCYRSFAEYLAERWELTASVPTGSLVADWGG